MRLRPLRFQLCCFYLTLSYLTLTVSTDGASAIHFADPRGQIPPFERRISHEPQPGDLLCFPPWLPHEVGSSPVSRDGPRISISFNYIDAERDYEERWGELTAGLEAVPLEWGLGLMAAPEEEDDD